ncbi:hypothetical protein C5E51_34465 [Nocardia nova]|uniref:hypothetical protein n=1 Tax=Nocardia nova TaxID=37330 RepID=UPI000CEA2F8E|nr:hypothetical protein [Nocardia nova]PPJ01221.1 hypothetical protein C5E51_34465 [Nocardia nova]
MTKTTKKAEKRRQQLRAGAAVAAITAIVGAIHLGPVQIEITVSHHHSGHDKIISQCQREEL